MIFAAISDRGLVREKNEDCFNAIVGNPNVPVTFIIADGMGGHNSGEVASKMAVDIVSELIMQRAEDFLCEEKVRQAIVEAMNGANKAIYLYSLKQKSNAGMGTTLIVTIFLNDKIYIGHVGDSRVYLIRDGNIMRVTVDHSYIEELVRMGTLSRKEAEKHPGKNVITRALGCGEDLQIDTYCYEVMENDYYVLCTDGLTNMLSENEIKKIVENSDNPQHACDQLVKKANEYGGEDNITVIVVKTGRVK
ncbi:MAG TPA: Stp1/IreP family PP2C-type Ser/Thr phosphatase [Clostridiaceae bacterium]|nr:Stp1/IreP family PP2C-type Ser/Thr phosphatase [Clostridiaceae bacterium]